MTHKLTIETKMKMDNIIENNVLNVSVLDSKVKLYKAFVLSLMHNIHFICNKSVPDTIVCLFIYGED